MTITFLQPDGVAIPAQAARQGSAALYGGGAGRPLGGRSGFRVDTQSSVLTVTSTTWTLGPCAAMIDPGFATAQGMYGWASDANISGSITASDATNTRIDIVYIQVNDSSAGDGSGAKSANVSYLAGTPSATPVAPALPARSFLVGTITVPKTGAGSPTVALNSARFVTAGGVLPVYTQAERDALSGFDGLAVRRMDIASRPTETWDGSKWLAYTTGAASLPSGYQAYGGSYGVPTWVKEPTNRVSLSGLVGSTSAISMNAATLYTIATVPTTAAPAVQKIFPVGVGPSVGYTGTIYVQTNGDIRFMPSVTFSGVAVANFYVSLEGISWLL